MTEHLRTRSIVDAVEEGLRRRILAGADAPGSVVTEVAVAELFGVGRPSAKAAVDRLVADGLLVRGGRRGCTVPTLDHDDVVDLYASRVLVESAAHVRLARRGRTPAAAHLANGTLRQAAALGSAGLVVDSDVEFHRALVAADGSPRLRRMHSGLMAEAHFCMARVQAAQLLRADVIADEHARILELIGTGDADAVADATRDHLHHARDKLLRSLAEMSPKT